MSYLVIFSKALFKLYLCKSMYLTKQVLSCLSGTVFLVFSGPRQICPLCTWAGPGHGPVPLLLRLTEVKEKGQYECMISGSCNFVFDMNAMSFPWQIHLHTCLKSTWVWVHRSENRLKVNDGLTQNYTMAKPFLEQRYINGPLRMFYGVLLSWQTVIGLRGERGPTFLKNRGGWEF